MDTQHTLLDYQSFSTWLQEQKIALTAAEMHGFISGMVCSACGDESWKTMLNEMTNDGVAYARSLMAKFEEIHQLVQQQLQEELQEGQEKFFLLLPTKEEHRLDVRAEALVGWVNHFLLALGVMKPNLLLAGKSVEETLKDLREISYLGYGEEDSSEAVEQALDEIIAYVRITTVFFLSEFSSPITVVAVKPMLH